MLTAGGAVERRQDWTDQARANLLKALAAQQAGRGGETKVATTREEAGADPAVVAELDRLHQAVGQSIQVHKLAGLPLPTKKDRFDWTLGEQAVRFGQATQYDYALFLHAEDSFASSGRVALQAVAFLGCMVAICMMPGGGQQAAYASLVDLKTGKVVWYNALASTKGDIRTEEGAREMVDRLLDRMKPGAAARAEDKARSRRS
jgi:2',3'-cyclic-nucleotide 2'-phosphodiesterase (5'-nucleotidase family)